MLFKRENKLQVLILTFEQCPSDGGINLMVSILKSQHASHCSNCIPCVLLLPLSHTVNLATMWKLQEQTWFSVNTNAAEPPCINSQHQWKSMPSPSEQLLAACLSPRRPPALQKSTKCTTHQHCQHCSIFSRSRQGVGGTVLVASDGLRLRWSCHMPRLSKKQQSLLLPCLYVANPQNLQGENIEIRQICGNTTYWFWYTAPYLTLDGGSLRSPTKSTLQLASHP